jgi:DNA-binding Xre family transcriptional regulator
MAVNYKKLWKLLIDRDMMKKDLAAAADISSYTISKMAAGNNVTVDVIGKICIALSVTPDEIMEILPDKKS